MDSPDVAQPTCFVISALLKVRHTNIGYLKLTQLAGRYIAYLRWVFYAREKSK